jgi:hypothetical protein
MSKVNLNIFVTVCIFIMMLTGHATAVTHYVSPGQSIQTAIDNANNSDEIEVAPGTYPEAINFNGKAVRLYSSGGPELTTIDANGLNSRVVTCDSGENANTILEGFTITGGNADFGGGMFNYQSNPTVINCIFSGNTATISGGAMRNYANNSAVTNCTFNGNTASNSGGGMSNYQGSSPTVTSCIFSGNTADNGCGMSNVQSRPTVTDCNFSGNTAAIRGGGMFNYNTSSPTVTNCTFSGYTADICGGGMYNNTSSPTVINCTFSGNTAIEDGGGMYNENESRPMVTNCTFNGNTAVEHGGGMANSASSPTVTNCILWSNTPGEIYNASCTPTVTYSDVQGGWPGDGNIDADPCFVAAGNLRLKPDSPCIDAGDTTVMVGISLDLDGNPRGLDDPKTPDTAISVAGVIVDMGAYEFQPCPIDGDNNCDGMVDFEDLAILCNNWLAGTEP